VSDNCVLPTLEHSSVGRAAVLETGPLPLQDHKSGTVCRPILDYVGCRTASSGGYWRHFYPDSEATAQCELFLTAPNRNILTYVNSLTIQLTYWPFCWQSLLQYQLILHMEHLRYLLAPGRWASPQGTHLRPTPDVVFLMSPHFYNTTSAIMPNSVILELGDGRTVYLGNGLTADIKSWWFSNKLVQHVGSVDWILLWTCSSTDKCCTLWVGTNRVKMH